MAEMPTRVEPVAGARVARFPWVRATTAVAALNDAATTLGSQLDVRAVMLPTLVDWSGTYRDDFDTTAARVGGVASGLKETFATLASSIVTAAEDANQAQRGYNAELDPAAPVQTARII